MGKVAHSANEKRSGRGGRRDWDGYPRGGPIGHKYVKVCPPQEGTSKVVFGLLGSFFTFGHKQVNFPEQGGGEVYIERMESNAPRRCGGVCSPGLGRMECLHVHKLVLGGNQMFLFFRADATAT